jgi:hypothetical protein
MFVGNGYLAGRQPFEGQGFAEVQLPGRTEPLSGAAVTLETPSGTQTLRSAAADGTDTTQWIGPTADATIQVDLGRTVPLGSVTVTRNPVTTFASTTGGKGVTMPTKSAGERVEASADGIQAAHSAARVRRQAACAEPPARPTVAHTRTATTGRSAPVPTSSSSGSSRRGRECLEVGLG